MYLFYQALLAVMRREVSAEALQDCLETLLHLVKGHSESLTAVKELEKHGGFKDLGELLDHKHSWAILDTVISRLMLILYILVEVYMCRFMELKLVCKFQLSNHK